MPARWTSLRTPAALRRGCHRRRALGVDAVVAARRRLAVGRDRRQVDDDVDALAGAAASELASVTSPCDGLDAGGQLVPARCARARARACRARPAARPAGGRRSRVEPVTSTVRFAPTRPVYGQTVERDGVRARREQALEARPVVALERGDLGSDLAAAIVERAHAQDLRAHRDRLLSRHLERELELVVGVEARWRCGSGCRRR